MKNRSILRKSAIILVLTMLFLPEALFAKGAVIGYASGDCDKVTNEQLEKLTHVMAVDLYINTDGSLRPNPELIQVNSNWLTDWLTR